MPVEGRRPITWGRAPRAFCEKNRGAGDRRRYCKNIVNSSCSLIVKVLFQGKFPLPGEDARAIGGCGCACALAIFGESDGSSGALPWERGGGATGKELFRHCARDGAKEREEQRGRGLRRVVPGAC